MQNHGNSKRKSAYGLLVWSLGAGFFFIEYFVRISPSVITHELMASLNVDALALGGLSAFFYYAYIGMLIPVGVIVDRFGAKWPMFFASVLCGFGCYLFSISTHIAVSDIARFITGFGASFSFVGALKWASQWFSARTFTLLAGFTQGLGMVGAAVGDAPMSIIFHHFGWRVSMFGISILFGALSILIVLFAKDFNGQEKVDPSEHIKVWSSLRIVLSNRQTWINGVYIGLLYAPTAAFAGLWGVSYISQYDQLSTIAAATDVGTIFIGIAIGCPLFGFMSNRIQKRVPLMFVSALGSLVFILPILYGHRFGVDNTGNLLLALCFCYGFFQGGLIPSYSLGAEINPHQLTGIAVGVTNMASVIVGALFIPLIGASLELLGAGAEVSGAPVFTTATYQTTFILLPVCLAVSCIVSLFVSETYAKRVVL